VITGEEASVISAEVVAGGEVTGIETEDVRDFGTNEVTGIGTE